MTKLFIATGVILALLVGTSIQGLAKNPKVYDANGQFMGILVDINPGRGLRTVKVFIEKLNSFAYVDSETGDIYREGGIEFDDYNCSGTAYAEHSPYFLARFGLEGIWQDSDRYLVPIPPLYRDICFKSRLNADGTCENFTQCVYGMGLQFIEIPRENIPFTLPFPEPWNFKY